MDPSFPVVPAGSDLPAKRRDDPLQRPVTLHAAGGIHLVQGSKLRQECWEAIGGRTRARLTELTGNLIDWYASTDPSSGDGRPYAVVFGDRALGIAQPRINSEHRPVYAISTFEFAPGSLLHMVVDHRPAPHGVAAGPAVGVPDEGGHPDLGREARGMLGNLPPKAQELLQAPFTGGQRIIRCDWSGEGFDHHLSMFMFVLAGPRDVTVASGTMVVPAGHTAATAHWSLTCYRATVARRKGV